MGPLEGLRVVELASIGPGPMCCMLLADLGADVRPHRPHRGQRAGRARWRRATTSTARNRRSVALDLKSPAGRDAVLRLVDGADVLIEGFRARASPSGSGSARPTATRATRALVYGRMTGFGPDRAAGAGRRARPQLHRADRRARTRSAAPAASRCRR